jgi:hypothetical protein
MSSAVNGQQDFLANPLDGLIHADERRRIADS